MSDLSPPLEPPTEPPPPQFECELRFSGRAAAWIRPAGKLELGSAAEFERAVKEALSSALLVVIDLRELRFIDSTGLHLIIDADARARRSGRRLVLVRGPAQIDRLFALGLSDRLRIVDLRPVLVSTPAIPAAQPGAREDQRFAHVEH